MRKVEPIAALELGTSRTVLAVGEPLENGRMRVAAKCETPSSGIRKSCITDVSQVTYSIESVLHRIERESGYGLGYAYLAVTGPHINTSDHATHWELGGRKVTEEDLTAVYNRSCDVGLNEEEHTLLDVVETGYAIDNLAEVVSPLGMSGRVLTLHTLCVRGSTDRIRDAKTAAAAAKLEIRDAYYAGTCAANAVLTNEMRQTGALVIDLGGGSTTCCAYADGHLVWTQVFGVGGDHVTNDIRYAFNLKKDQAESLKMLNGSCSLDRKDSEGNGNARLDIPDSMPGALPVSIPHRSLDIVINARMSELFSIILARIDELNLLQRLGFGVVFTGGGAALRGITQLGESIFGLPCHVGKLIPEIEGLEGEAHPEAFASILGLLLVSQLNATPQQSLFSSLSGCLKGIFRK